MSVLMPTCAGVWGVPDPVSGRWNTSSTLTDVAPHWEINRQLLGSFYFSPGSQWWRAKLGRDGECRGRLDETFGLRRIAQRKKNWTERLEKDKTASRVGIWRENIPERRDHWDQRPGLGGSLVCFKISYSQKVVLFECNEQIFPLGFRYTYPHPPPSLFFLCTIGSLFRVLNKRIIWSELHKENDLWSGRLSQWLEQVMAFHGHGFDSSTTK